MRSVWLHDPKTTIVFMRIQTDTVEQPAHEAPIEYVMIVDRLGLNQWTPQSPPGSFEKEYLVHQN